MKILITSGAGLIGSAVVRYVLEKSNDSIVKLDALTYAGNLGSLADAEMNKNSYGKYLLDMVNEHG